MQLKLFTLLAFAVTLVSGSLYHPDTPHLLGHRQAPGTPEYQCHADCGSVIQLGRTTDYCTNTNFTSALTRCLNCAVQYNVWSSYGASVTRAAQGCGLSAVPVNGTGINATTTANGTATITSSAITRPASTSGSITGTGSVTAQSASSTTTSRSAAATLNSPIIGDLLIYCSLVAALVFGLEL